MRDVAVGHTERSVPWWAPASGLFDAFKNTDDGPWAPQMQSFRGPSSLRPGW